MTTSPRFGSLLAVLLLSPLAGCDGPAATPDAPVTADAPAVDAPTTTDTGIDAPSGADTGIPDAPVTTDAPPDAPPGRDLAILLVGDLDPTAFAATSFRAWLDEQGTITELAEPTFSATALADVDLLVIGFLPRALNTPERTAFGTWTLLNDGRAIVLGGYDTDGRAAVHSVTSVLGIAIDQVRTTFPTDPTAFVAGAVSQGSLTTAPPIAGAFTIDSIGLGAALEIRTTAGDDVAARWEAESSDGAVFVVTDDHPTLDANWNDDVAEFWGNVISFLFDSAS